MSVTEVTEITVPEIIETLLKVSVPEIIETILEVSVPEVTVLEILESLPVVSVPELEISNMKKDNFITVWFKKIFGCKSKKKKETV